MTKSLATFAGGCFWCMVKPFDRYDGVLSVVSGYTGGDVENPSYELVCTNTTGHREAVQITFDEEIISYEALLRGESYQTAIYYHTPDQQRLAEKSKSELDASGKFDKPIATEIRAVKPFYKAEEGHQNYYMKNPTHYNRYAVGSGREQFKTTNWGNEE